MTKRVSWQTKLNDIIAKEGDDLSFFEQFFVQFWAAAEDSLEDFELHNLAKYIANINAIKAQSPAGNGYLHGFLRYLKDDFDLDDDGYEPCKFGQAEFRHSVDC